MHLANPISLARHTLARSPQVTNILGPTRAPSSQNRGPESGSRLYDGGTFFGLRLATFVHGLFVGAITLLYYENSDLPIPWQEFGDAALLVLGVGVGVNTLRRIRL